MTNPRHRSKSPRLKRSIKQQHPRVLGHSGWGARVDSMTIPPLLDVFERIVATSEKGALRYVRYESWLDGHQWLELIYSLKIYFAIKCQKVELEICFVSPLLTSVLTLASGAWTPAAGCRSRALRPPRCPTVLHSSGRRVNCVPNRNRCPNSAILTGKTSTTILI